MESLKKIHQEQREHLESAMNRVWLLNTGSIKRAFKTGFTLQTDSAIANMDSQKFVPTQKKIR